MTQRAVSGEAGDPSETDSESEMLEGAFFGIRRELPRAYSVESCAVGARATSMSMETLFHHLCSQTSSSVGGRVRASEWY